MSTNADHAVGGPGCTHPSAVRRSGASTGHGTRRRRADREVGTGPRLRREREAEAIGELVELAAHERDSGAARAPSAHRPVKRGGRFSKNAAMPSARSSVVEIRRFRSDSSRNASARVRSRPRCTASRAAAWARGAPPRQLLGERHGSRTGIGVEHREPAAHEGAGVDGVADHEQLQRERHATGAGQPLRSTPARQLAVTDLGERHRRRRSR